MGVSRAPRCSASHGAGLASRQPFGLGLSPERELIRVDMPPSFVNDPEHWRDRAREKRALAEHLRNEQAKQAILRIANDYERLAERAEERSRGSPKSK